MDSISAVASSAANQARETQAVDTMVLKKVLDVQAQTAMALINSLPQQYSNPAHLGGSVDVKV